MSDFFFVSIKKTDVFLSPIEVKPSQWLAVIVIQQNTEVTLRVTSDYSLCIHFGTDYGFNDVVAFRLFLGRDNQIFLATVLLRSALGWSNRQRCNSHRLVSPVDCGLKAVIYLVTEKLCGRLPGKVPKLLAHFLSNNPAAAKTECNT